MQSGEAEWAHISKTQLLCMVFFSSTRVCRTHLSDPATLLGFYPLHELVAHISATQLLYWGLYPVQELVAHTSATHPLCWVFIQYRSSSYISQQPSRQNKCDRLWLWNLFVRVAHHGMLACPQITPWYFQATGTFAGDLHIHVCFVCKGISLSRASPTHCQGRAHTFLSRSTNRDMPIPAHRMWLFFPEAFMGWACDHLSDQPERLTRDQVASKPHHSSSYGSILWQEANRCEVNRAYFYLNMIYNNHVQMLLHKTNIKKVNFVKYKQQLLWLHCIKRLRLNN